MSGVSDRIDLMRTFVRIAETGSLSAAARSLGLTQPTVSRQLSQLENRLGVRLIERTTHRLNFTAEGTACLERSRDIIAAWEGMAENAQSGSKELSGPLRIVAPVALGRSVLAEIAAGFMAQYPRVSLDLVLTDGLVDLIADGADALIRAGPVKDETLIVRRLGDAERILVAHSGLAKDIDPSFGPESLSSHPFISISPFYENRLMLLSHDRDVEISIKPVMSTNDIGAAHTAARAGAGIALLPAWLVRKDLENGALTRIGVDCRGRPTPIHLAYPVNRFRTKRLTAFMDVLRDEIPRRLSLD